MTEAGDQASFNADKERAEAIEDVIDSVVAALRAGKHAELEDVIREHPEFKAELRRLLPVVLALEMPLRTSDAPAVHEQSGDGEAAHAVRNLGDFRLIREVGRGGMGVVYEAEQLSLQRRVALKVLPLAAMLDERQLTRFRNEARAAATLVHPHIVPVYAVGCDRGVHYYAMQFIGGRSLAEIIRQLRDAASLEPTTQLPGAGEGMLPGNATVGTLGQAFLRDRPASRIEARLRGQAADSTAINDYVTEWTRDDRQRCRIAARLVADVADALEQAHAQGIVHRDIKPANLLLDEQGKIWVTDFGLAQLETDASLTMTGDVLGTLRYLSPEQAQGQRRLVDQRSDIYSLGLSLYELLTLRPAFTATDRAQLLKEVLEEEPRPPRALKPEISRDLETIVLKAIAKEPALRYQSARDMAEDLRRCLERRPIKARRPTLHQRLTKWALRHAAIVWTAAVMLLLTTLTLSVSTMWVSTAYRRERNALAGESQARIDADRLARQSKGLLSLQYVASGAQLVEAGDLSRALPWFIAALELDHDNPPRETMHRTRLAMTLQQVPGLVGCGIAHDAVFDSQNRPLAVRIEDRIATVYDLTREQPVGEPVVLPEPLHDAPSTLSPNGRWLMTFHGTSSINGVRVWEISTGRLVLENTGLQPYQISDNRVANFAFSPNGERVVLLPRTGKGMLWETRSGHTVPSDGTFENGRELRFSTNGTTLVWQRGWEAPEVCLWSAATGVRSVQLSAHSRFLRDLRISHDGRRFVTSSFDTTARIWDVATLAPIGSPLEHDDFVQRASFSPDDRTIVTASGDHTARLWDAATGSPKTPPLRHDGELTNAAFSRDGRYVVTTSRDTTARIWETRSGRLAYPILRHHGQVQRASFDSTGRHLMTMTTDGLAHVWDLAAAHAPGVLTDAYGWGSGSFVGEGETVLDGSYQPRVWNSDSGQPISPPLVHDVVSSPWTAAAGPEGRRIVTMDRRGRIRIWDATTFRPLTPVLAQAKSFFNLSIRRPLFITGGKQALTLRIQNSGIPGEADVWDTRSGEALRWPVTSVKHVMAVAASADGRYVATGNDASGRFAEHGGVLELWDGCDGTRVGEPISHAGLIRYIAFSPDGKKVASLANSMGESKGEARVFAVPSGKPVSPPIRQETYLVSIAFSPDGKRLITTGRDRATKIWDVATGKLLLPPLHHQERLMGAAFSPDGQFLLTRTGFENNASRGLASTRIWDATTGQPLSPPLRHSDELACLDAASFSRDGERVVTSSRDGTTRIWRISQDERAIEDLRQVALLLSARELNAVGSLLTVEADEQLAAWQKWRASHPDGFAASDRQVIAWRHRQAIECMKSELWEEATAHLSTLINTLPAAHTGLRDRRAECATALGDWETAHADLQAIIAGGGMPATEWLRAAVVALTAGDGEAYRTMCHHLISDLAAAEDPTTAWLSARVAALAPGGLTDHGPAIALARRSLEQPPDKPRWILGALLLRDGQYEEAAEELVRAYETVKTNTVLYEAWLLAITHHHLGHREEARQWLSTARQHADEALNQGAISPIDRQTMRLLRDEAENLIERAKTIGVSEDTDGSSPD